MEGPNQVISGTAVDNAGNTATASATLNIDKVRTGDLGGSASTAQFTQALVARLKA